MRRSPTGVVSGACGVKAEATNFPAKDCTRSGDSGHTSVGDGD